jgi:hypothetical protein
MLNSLEIQLLAYPRAKTLIFDFIGWSHERVLSPPRQNKRIARPSSPLPEIIIRGLEGEQREKVVELVSAFVNGNGRVGTTSSHFLLAEGGVLVEVTPGPVVWKMIETAHLLLEQGMPALESLTIDEADMSTESENGSSSGGVGTDFSDQSD